MIDEYTKELERALNPRKWDKELNDAGTKASLTYKKRLMKLEGLQKIDQK